MAQFLQARPIWEFVSRERVKTSLRALILFMGLCMGNQTVADTTSTLATITTSQLALGVKALRQAADEPNSAVSPYSVHAALTLARFGAKGEAATALDSVLGLKAPTSAVERDLYRQLNEAVLREKGGASLAKIANSIWISDRGAFREEYKKSVVEALSASTHTVSFQDPEGARETINKWISRQTEEKIPRLLPAGTFSSRSVAALANALYFKAPWQTPFSPDSTAPDTFTIKPGVTKQVPMMWGFTKGAYYENEAWQAALLPYEGESYSFLLLVPKQSVAVDKLRADVSAEAMSTALAEGRPARVSVRMPRFSVRRSWELSSGLSSMGLSVIFSPRADFSGITDLPVKLDAVRHEAFVAVDESGTEAAAATAVTFATSTAPGAQEEVRELVANHPFVFGIFHNQTRAPLLVGIVGDPSIKS